MFCWQAVIRLLKMDGSVSAALVIRLIILPFCLYTREEGWVCVLQARGRKAEDSSLESEHQGPQASTAHKQMCPCPQPSAATHGKAGAQ